MPKLVSPAVGRITSGFGPRTAPTAGASTYHKGVDIADYDDVIVAPTDGVVVTVAYNSTSGNYVVIDHGAGVRTRHQHLAAREVCVGDRVVAGQRIGPEGRTGNVTGVHLHTEVHVNGVQVNPTTWYAEHGVTLGSAGEGWWGAQPTPVSSAPGFSQVTADYQARQNRYANAGLVVDGDKGPKTRAWEAWTLKAQDEMNKWKSTSPDIAEDGDYGQRTNTRAAELQRRNGLKVTGFLSNSDAAYMRKHGSSLPNRPRTN